MVHNVNDKTSLDYKDDNDSGFNSEEEASTVKKKRTKAQENYRRANAAIIPDFIPPEERKATDCLLKEIQLYTPNNGLSKKEEWRYICQATEWDFSMEQALAILHVNKYNIEKAREDFKIFTPLPSQWPHDKAKFIAAFKELDKFFYAIKDRFFPDRSVADMVEYYYTWKMEKKRRKIRDQWRREQLLQLNIPSNKDCPERKITTIACRRTANEI